MTYEKGKQQYKGQTTRYLDERVRERIDYVLITLEIFTQTSLQENILTFLHMNFTL